MNTMPHAAVPQNPTSPMPKRAWRGAFFGLALALFVLMTINVMMGEAAGVTPADVWQVIARHLPGLSRTVAKPSESMQSIVWEQRLPRALGGAVIGMLLAMAGVAFQSFLRNPLADPYMVGVSSGAALGSVLIILFGGEMLLGGFAQPLAAFASGLCATIFVYLLARKGGRVSAQTFLLAGIVVGTFLWSLIPLTLSLANRAGNLDRQTQILSQLLGNISYLGWRGLYLLLPFGIVGMAVLWSGARELNLMAQGEETAIHLGVDAEAFKRRVIVSGALATAAAVSVAGIIAFVGLVVPHIARRLVGPDHRVLLPVAMLLGGLVLVTADWLARLYLGNLEIGVVTSLLGAPVFCYLLRRQLATRI
jgi:iron complex transport system permease protein